MKKDTSKISLPEINFDTPALVRHRKSRAVGERLTAWFVGFGGISVILAIMLIFIYLLYEVVPLFRGAAIVSWIQDEQVRDSYILQDSVHPSIHLSLEEQNTVALKIDRQGNAIFFNAVTGQIRNRVLLNSPNNSSITAFALDTDASHLFALGLDNSQVLIAKHQYDVSYPDDARLITPKIIYPYGEARVDFGADFGALQRLAISDQDNTLILVASNTEQKLGMLVLSKEKNFITEEVQLSPQFYSLPELSTQPEYLFIAPDQHWLLALDRAGNLSLIDIRKPNHTRLASVHKASRGHVTDAALLLGGASLMIADNQGYISQWMLVRDQNNDWDLNLVRDFIASTDSPVTNLAMEHRRKGFAAVDVDGVVSIYNSTASNQVLSQPLHPGPIHTLVFSPRANALMVEDKQGALRLWQVDNQYPEVSWSALWKKIWYEGYATEDYIWQSSAATTDFEPKYSLMPLSFGTLKAAFYAMLMAMPLAICSAIYTAYFMAPTLRRKVKPLIELMEAVPTVILGFLAGLWLAPLVETRLAGIFTILLVVPVGTLIFAYLWSQLPKTSRWQLPEGWDLVLLIPLIMALVAVSIPLSSLLEDTFFSGSLRQFITYDMGIDYDQRNALVVGLAMGFAVIPTIFSITEDAIFSVPKHLTQGSLALGATPWQTLVGVVLLTASPGIFSAVMIGMGRAVGETMIVLMATGNTPIMDVNIFEGMRTLAANIAVEMPESEVGSSHYRILFLAALVLFMFTFVVNTLAELVRQRLRVKYGSL